MKKLQELLASYISVILMGCILIIFTITRMWQLMNIPSGLHYDEAAMAYSSWCLSQYGVDRHLISWPIYLINYGHGQSSLYPYLLAGLFKLFGYHVMLIRIPAVFFSLLTLLFTMASTKLIFPKYKYAPYITGILITICPYYIMASRLGLDCNLMLGCAATFFYCFLKAIDSEKKIWYVLAGISGGIMLYSYVLSYLILPLFLIFSLCYTILTHKFSFVRWFLMAIPMGILAFPLILEQIVNIFDLEPFKLGIFTITRIDFYRVAEIGRFQCANLISALQSIFIGDILPYNSIPGFPNLYWLSIPLTVIGLVRILQKLILSLQQRKICLSAFVFLWFFTVVYIACHISSNANRLNGVFFACTLLTIEGILFFVGLNKYIKKIVPAVISLLFMICFIRFSNYYYCGGYFSDTHPLPYFDILTPEAIDFIENHPEYGEKGTQMAEPPVYLGLSILRSPYELCLFNKDLYVLGYYHCSHLGLIEDGYYYIVRDIYADYANELRSMGYTEIVYDNYSLFYQE